MVRWSWTQPCCSHCYQEHYPNRDPVRIVTREIENCVYCMSANRSGIYVRLDPAEAPYPSMERQ